MLAYLTLARMRVIIGVCVRVCVCVCVCVTYAVGSFATHMCPAKAVSLTSS